MIKRLIDLFNEITAMEKMGKDKKKIKAVMQMVVDIHGLPYVRNVMFDFGFAYLEKYLPKQNKAAAV